MGTANAQTILNGGLEPQDWPLCAMSPPYPPDSVLEQSALMCAGGLFYFMVNDCFPYIKTAGGEIDVFHEDCLAPGELISENPFVYEYVAIGPPSSEGQYYLALGVRYGDPIYDELSMELSDSLQEGEWYKLTYDIMSASFYAEFIDSATNFYDSVHVEIGLSNGEYTFGESIHQSDLPTPGWSTQTVVFQALSDTINYITCKVVQAEGAIGRNALFIDNFVLSTDTSTVGWQELQNTPQLLRIIDVLGRESKPKPNVPLFYIYTDGTVEKRLIIE